MTRASANPLGLALTHGPRPSAWRSAGEHSPTGGLWTYRHKKMQKPPREFKTLTRFEKRARGIPYRRGDSDEERSSESDEERERREAKEELEAQRQMDKEKYACAALPPYHTQHRSFRARAPALLGEERHAHAHRRTHTTTTLTTPPPLRAHSKRSPVAALPAPPQTGPAAPRPWPSQLRGRDEEGVAAEAAAVPQGLLVRRARGGVHGARPARTQHFRATRSVLALHS